MRKRKCVNKAAILKAAHIDDRAAEANDELNAYNVAITRIVQDYFEQNKVCLTEWLNCQFPSASTLTKEVLR